MEISALSSLLEKGTHSLFRNQFIYLFVSVILRIKPRLSNMLSKHSTDELHLGTSQMALVTPSRAVTAPEGAGVYATTQHNKEDSGQRRRQVLEPPAHTQSGGQGYTYHLPPACTGASSGQSAPAEESEDTCQSWTPGFHTDGRSLLHPSWQQCWQQTTALGTHCAVSYN